MTTPDERPTPKRALLCLLLNLIVFPGLGTLASGQSSRKKTGVFQLTLGVLLVPLLVVVTLGGALFGGFDPETAKAWLGNILLILVVWNVYTGIQIFRD